MCFHFAFSTQIYIVNHLNASYRPTPVFLFKARASSCHQEIRSAQTVLSNLHSRAERSGSPRNALCRIEVGLPGQSYELYLTTSVRFMIIRAYLGWNEVLFARAHSGKGHFLDLIDSHPTAGYWLFYFSYLFLRHSHLRHWQISC